MVAYASPLCLHLDGVLRLEGEGMEGAGGGRLRRLGMLGDFLHVDGFGPGLLRHRVVGPPTRVVHDIRLPIRLLGEGNGCKRRGGVGYEDMITGREGYEGGEPP